jgi:hypothetical protein
MMYVFVLFLGYQQHLHVTDFEGQDGVQETAKRRRGGTTENRTRETPA